MIALLLALALGAAPDAPEPAEAPPEPVALSIEGEITETSAGLFIAALEGAAEGAPISVHVNTEGGEADSALLIARALEAAAKTHTVECTVDGEAVSAGFLVLQSCQVRVMTLRSIAMAHEPYLPGLDLANRRRLHNADEHLRVSAEQYVTHCAARLRISKKAFRQHIANGVDWWMTASEALAVGAVDRIVPSPNAALHAPPPEP